MEMGPLKVSYPCTDCEFTGSSARQLSRHKAVTHVKNPLTCILCPFVTAYQTNLLRHRREVHGILGSKGNKSCKFCGFEAHDNNTLIVHQQEAHQDILRSARERFAREKKSARGSSSPLSLLQTFPPQDHNFNDSGQGDKMDADLQKDLNNQNEDDEDRDFWKEGFMDNPPNLLMNLAEAAESLEFQSKKGDKSLRPSDPLPVIENSSSDYTSSRASTPMASTKSPRTGSPSHELNNTCNLAPTRIRRQYSCNDCGFRTVNPREFLYHRRDVHNQKVKIVECPYCVYACQYFQKLQRHMLLVHKLETSMTPPAEVLAGGPPSTGGDCTSNDQKSKSLLLKSKLSTKPSDPSGNSVHAISPKSAKATVPPLKLKVKLNPSNQSTSDDSPPQETYSYSVIKNETDEFDEKISSENIDGEDGVEEGTMEEGMEGGMEVGTNLKKKYFRCSTCGYTTNVQYLYKKHIKYHSAPKIKCDLCDFESPYSWNVERHARSHRIKGAYKCLKCNFSSDKPQAITIHVNQHHREKGEPIPQITEDELTQEDDENDEDLYGNIAEGLDTIEDIQDDENQIDERQLAEEDEFASKFSPNASAGPNMAITKQFDIKPMKPNFTSKGVTYVRKADGKIVAKPIIANKKCKYCTFTTDSINKLQKHETSFHPEKRFQCPLCEIRFENLVWLQRHLAHMHQEDQFANNIVNILDMLNPKKRRNISKPIQNISINEAMTPKQPKIPPKRNLAIGPLDPNESTKCRICGYQTRWISELQKHMRVHTNEKPFSCPYCSFKSKWKGDLNRHIQKYHSLLPMPDLNAMEREALRAFSIEPQEAQNENNSSMVDTELDPDLALFQDDMENDMIPLDAIKIQQPQSLNAFEQGIQNEEGDSARFGKVKVYKCCYCEFICNTASRFHVHFVQHLNTKPFMCSICGHRSNWEWDVTKHIKMKSQRDSGHFEAKPVLMHESGKRDYKKYDKYLVWVNHADADNSMSGNKIDFRAKRQKISDHGEMGDQVEMPLEDSENDKNQDYEANVDPESIVITPDISYAFGSQSDDMETSIENEVIPPAPIPSSTLQPNVPYVSEKSEVPPTAPTTPARKFYCAYCDYTHRDSKALVSHLSVHSGKKPYKCKHCNFSSNWKEVISRHASSRHNGGVKDVEQLFKYTVTKYICRIIDESGDLNLGPEVITPELIAEKTYVEPKASKKMDQNSPQIETTNPSVIENVSIPKHNSTRISGFKGSFKCDICPFRAEKAFHMDFHLKRHQQKEGADQKCPHCPYWVNAKKSLVKHIYLHEYENELVLQEGMAFIHGDDTGSILNDALTSNKGKITQEMSEDDEADDME